MNKKTVLGKDVAINELESFINKYVKKPCAKEELEATYPDILDAIMDGYVTFDSELVPTLKLKDPIKNEKGDVSVSEINFKTRIKPTELANLAKGLNPSTEIFMLQLRMTANIIGQPVAMMDMFSRYDLDVVNQISTVFS